jgi:hypothetical protein
MNNSVQKIETNSVDKFLNQRVGGVNTQSFWLPAKKEDEGDKFYISDIQKMFILPEDARKTNNTKVIGLSIAGATLITAAGVFLLLKGGPRGLAKGFNKLRDYLENKILTSKLNTGKAPNKTILYLLSSVESASERAEAINNFVSFKDVLFKNFMAKTKITDRIHNGTTRVFGKIGRRTVKNAYTSTAGKFKGLKTLSDSISDKILGKNPTEVIEIDGIALTREKWLEKIGVLNEEICSIFSSNFSENALMSRLVRMKHAVGTLYEKFKRMDIFWSKDSVTTFIAESLLKSEKTAIQKNVRSYRKAISYNMSDMLESANAKILEISKVIGYKDSENMTKLGTLKGNIKEFVHSGKFDDIKKQQILDNITELKHEAERLIKDEKIKPADKEAFLTVFDDLRKGIDGYKEGKVQNVLNIYKKLLPEDEYAIVARAYNDGVKSLDRSIKVETEDYMSKLRDLTLGSAPTDILTILISLGVLGYHLGKSKDADQRQSIALKYGFPAIAGIGVSLYCNAKLYAGSKSLIVGALSTWVLNRIGEWGDKKLKNIKAKKQPAQK